MKIKPSLGFFVSWLITFLAMYGTSYWWHGVLLNDLTRVSISIEFFLLFVAIIYFVVSFVLTFLVSNLKQVGANRLQRGVLIGLPMGIFIFLIAFVFGISFYSNPNMNHILLDLGWQMLEQTLGGVVAAVCLNIATAFSHSNAQ